MDAERAYLFRHALLRDAAYQLQLPRDRARLHGFAFAALEESFGGRPPAPPPLDASSASLLPSHPVDPFAEELAWHARLSGEADPDVLLQYLRRAATFADRGFRHDAAQATWEAFAAQSQGADRAEGLLNASQGAAYSGRSVEAERLILGACEGFERLGDDRRLAVAISNLASHFLDTAQPGRSAEAFERALVLHRKVGNRRFEGIVLGNLGNLHRQAGRLAEAERTYAAALALHREVGNRSFEGIAVGSLGSAYYETGRTALAEEAFEASLAIHRETGNARFEGITLGNLARLQRDLGRTEEAERGFQRCLELLRRVGDRRTLGSALGNVANDYALTGRRELAERTYQDALVILKEVGDRRAEGIVVGNIAGLYGETGREELAEATYLEALDIHRQSGNRRWEGLNGCHFALFLVSIGRRADAVPRWTAGIAIVRDLQDHRQMDTLLAAMRDACSKAGAPPLE